MSVTSVTKIMRTSFGKVLQISVTFITKIMLTKHGRTEGHLCLQLCIPSASSAL